MPAAKTSTLVRSFLHSADQELEQPSWCNCWRTISGSRLQAFKSQVHRHMIFVPPWHVYLIAFKTDVAVVGRISNWFAMSTNWWIIYWQGLLMKLLENSVARLGTVSFLKGLLFSSKGLLPCLIHRLHVIMVMVGQTSSCFILRLMYILSCCLYFFNCK